MNLTCLFSTRSPKWSAEDPDPYLLLLGPVPVAQQVAVYVGPARSTANGFWIANMSSPRRFPRGANFTGSTGLKALLGHVFQQLEIGAGSRRNPTIFFPVFLSFVLQAWTKAAARHRALCAFVALRLYTHICGSENKLASRVQEDGQIFFISYIQLCDLTVEALHFETSSNKSRYPV